MNFNALQSHDGMLNGAIHPPALKRKADMPSLRVGLATGVVDGKIYAIGGNNFVPLSVVEVYDPATDMWTEEVDMHLQRYSLSVSVVDGKIYALGGFNDQVIHGVVEAFDTGLPSAVNPVGKLSTTWGAVKAAR